MSQIKQLATSEQQHSRAKALTKPFSLSIPLKFALALLLAALISSTAWAPQSNSVPTMDSLSRFYKRVIRINNYLFDGVEETTVIAFASNQKSDLST